jgi:A/G-specific adenine glycosylase
MDVGLFKRQLLAWWNQNRRDFPWRRKSASQYVMILSEVFLQRTTASAVAAFLPGFVARFPTWKAIAALDEAVLAEELRPLGLYRRRAATLLPLAAEMARRRGRFPGERSEVESLPGVGQYIANAVLMFCHGQSQPLLDVNMARVLERYFGPRTRADIRYDPYLQELAGRVVDGDAVSTNWAVLDFGAVVCRVKNPLCAECPLADGCRYAGEQLRSRSGEADEFRELVRPAGKSAG